MTGDAQPAAPWAPLIDDLLRRRYGSLAPPAAQAVREAWTRSLAASSYSTYASKLRKYLQFCASTGRTALPAAPETLELYVGHLMQEGRVQARYFDQYISAIRAVHRDLLLPYPTSPVLAHLIKGAMHLQRSLVLHEESWPLPAVAAASALRLAATLASPAVVRACLAVGLGFACMMRGSSVQGLAPGDVSLAGSSLQVVERVRKGHSHSDPVARSLAIASSSLPDLLLAVAHWQKLQHLQFAASPTPPAYFFQLPGEGLAGGDHFAGWFWAAVEALGLQPPQGRRLHPHCVRRGAASAARALGVPMERICRLGGWAITSTAVWRYIDSLVPATAEGFQFFGHLLPPGLRQLWAPAPP